MSYQVLLHRTAQVYPVCLSPVCTMAHRDHLQHKPRPRPPSAESRPFLATESCAIGTSPTGSSWPILHRSPDGKIIILIMYFILSAISPYITGLKALFNQSDCTGTAPIHK